MNASLSTLRDSDTSRAEILPDESRAVQRSFQLVPAAPLLEEVLHEIEPLPRAALFLGQAEDGLPVLLNLSDPAPEPVLILGKHGSGKTDLLRVIAQFVISTQTPGQVQFAVLTDRMEEWQERLADAPHCVGVFYNREPAASQLLRSLAMWVNRPGRHHQSVLLLIDGLEAVLPDGESSSLSCLRQILAEGTGRKVWTIATCRVQQGASLQEWIALFRSCITACDRSIPEADPQRPWFSVMKHGRQLDFWIPSPGF